MKSGGKSASQKLHGNMQWHSSVRVRRPETWKTKMYHNLVLLSRFRKGKWWVRDPTLPRRRPVALCPFPSAGDHFSRYTRHSFASPVYFSESVQWAIRVQRPRLNVCAFSSAAPLQKYFGERVFRSRYWTVPTAFAVIGLWRNCEMKMGAISSVQCARER